MTKNTKKISFLDYSILFISLIFFSIVYFYSSIIWPREEKFKNIDRSRMERLDDAQKLYNVLTDDYLEDASTLFALIEAIKDTLDGDEFFEGKKDVVLANKFKQYVIKDIFGDSSNNDTVLVKESEVRSFEFSEGVKLYSKYIYSKMDSSIFNSSISPDKIQEMLSSSNALAEEDKNYRLLKENIVEAERAIYAIEEAIKTDGKDLLNTDELTKINDSISYLKKAVINNDVNEIKDAISKLENTCEFYVERRMNNSIKSLIAGKDINDII